MYFKKVLSFSLKSKQREQKWQHFWKKWGLRNCIIAIVRLVSFLTTKPCLSTIHASVERKNIRQCLEIPSLIGGLVFFALFTPSRSCLRGAHGVSDNVFKRILLILFGVRIHQITQEHSVVLGLFLLAAGAYSHFFLDHTKQGWEKGFIFVLQELVYLPRLVQPQLKKLRLTELN